MRAQDRQAQALHASAHHGALSPQVTAIVKIAMRAGAAASAAASVPPPAVPTTAPVRTGIGFYQQQQAPTTAPMAGAKRPAQYDAPTTAPADKRSRVGEGGAAVGTAGGYAAAVAAADAAADAGAQYGADAAVRGEELRRELDPLSSVDLEAESRAPEIVPREGGAVDEAARFGTGEHASAHHDAPHPFPQVRWTRPLALGRVSVRPCCSVS